MSVKCWPMNRACNDWLMLRNKGHGTCTWCSWTMVRRQLQCIVYYFSTVVVVVVVVLQVDVITNTHMMSYLWFSGTLDCVVDASRCGNPSRFINHSCDPNCELQRWYCGEEIRIGIFAIKNIEKGAELTYDYQLSAVQSFVCKCGSANCRGTLKKISLADMKKEEEK